MTQTFRWHFVAEPQAVQAARHRLDELPRAESARDVHDALALLVSELITNSIRHGAASTGESIDLEVQLEADRARVEVSDPGGGFEPPPAPSKGEPRSSGWGLYMVERIADRWGVAGEGRTRVWFELEGDWLDCEGRRN